MTKDYSHAISWIENHNSPDNYEDGDYQEFYNDARNKFAHSELFGQPEFEDGLEKLWENYHNEDIPTEDISSDIGIDLAQDTITRDKVISVTRAIIQPEQAPVRIDSNTPIRITPLPRIEPTLPKGTIIVTPPSVTPLSQPQRISLAQRISSGIRRLFGRRR